MPKKVAAPSNPTLRKLCEVFALLAKLRLSITVSDSPFVIKVVDDETGKMYELVDLDDGSSPHELPSIFEYKLVLCE